MLIYVLILVNKEYNELIGKNEKLINKLKEKRK